MREGLIYGRLGATAERQAQRVRLFHQRWLVDWDDVSVDAEAWLDFVSAAQSDATSLRMSKVDPEADFSYDFEDLAFVRTAACD